MRRSLMLWAAGVVAPWCVGMVMLVSFTADAGQTGGASGSVVLLSDRAPSQPDDLVPPRSAALLRDLGALVPTRQGLLVAASYTLGTESDFKTLPDETEPRIAFKTASGAFPTIDRSHKGDPFVGLRPTFDSALDRPGGLARLGKNAMLAPHDDATPTAGFSLSDDGGPLDGATSFAPWNEGEDMEDAVAEPSAGSAAIAMRPAALLERLAQGATPPVSRAEALSSTTPAPLEGAPVAANLGAERFAEPNATVVPRVLDRPDYAAFLSGEHGARERKCLAEAIYFEARSEPEDGQAAVAQVVLNRATSGLYPASICGVVYQNRTHYKACQFSFACEGKSLRITEQEPWHTAVRIADAVLQGRTYLSDIGGATHYHAKYVRPGWARRLVKMDVIGHHVFYKLHSGQI